MATTIKSTKQLVGLIWRVIFTLLFVSAWPSIVEYFQLNQSVEIFFKVTVILFAYCFLFYFSYYMGNQIGLHIIDHQERKRIK